MEPVDPGVALTALAQQESLWPDVRIHFHDSQAGAVVVCGGGHGPNCSSAVPSDSARRRLATTTAAATACRTCRPALERQIGRVALDAGTALTHLTEPTRPLVVSQGESLRDHGRRLRHAWLIQRWLQTVTDPNIKHVVSRRATSVIAILDALSDTDLCDAAANDAAVTLRTSTAPAAARGLHLVLVVVDKLAGTDTNTHRAFDLIAPYRPVAVTTATDALAVVVPAHIAVAVAVHSSAAVIDTGRVDHATATAVQAGTISTVVACAAELAPHHPRSDLLHIASAVT